MIQPDVATELTSLHPGPNGDSTARDVVGVALEAEVARSRVSLDQARFEIDLATRVQERLLKEIDRLEHRLADTEAERLELLEQVTHRDRLLAQVFSSRSWRWTQALRRRLGRG